MVVSAREAGGTTIRHENEARRSGGGSLQSTSISLSFYSSSVGLLSHSGLNADRVHTTLVTFSYLVISDRIRRNDYSRFWQMGMARIDEITRIFLE
jgi:hypothetical protein